LAAGELATAEDERAGRRSASGRRCGASRGIGQIWSSRFVGHSVQPRTVRRFRPKLTSTIRRGLESGRRVDDFGRDAGWPVRPGHYRMCNDDRQPKATSRSSWTALRVQRASSNAFWMAAEMRRRSETLWPLLRAHSRMACVCWAPTGAALTVLPRTARPRRGWSGVAAATNLPDSRPLPQSGSSGRSAGSRSGRWRTNRNV
jgi:hypothetical protein